MAARAGGRIQGLSLIGAGGFGPQKDRKLDTRSYKSANGDEMLFREIVRANLLAVMPPVVTVDPGDTVRFRTLIAGWDVEPPASADEEGPKFSPRQKGLDDGHALCGPVAIRGAEPGMVLEVHIECVEPDHWGWSTGGGWENDRNKRLGVAGGDSSSHLWQLDAANRIGRSQSGHSLALNPFMGVLGMPPVEAGVHQTWQPRATGGNLDCKELIAGTVLFLPIAVSGGLFSTGDGHAVQGDGEVSGVAIECPMKRVDLTLDLHSDLELAAPRALTAEGWDAHSVASPVII